MILIIGGRAEDKIKFCRQRFKAKNEEILESLYDFIKAEYEKLSEDEILSYIFGFKIIAADEIGCGIVPMDKKERIFRDFYGSICCKAAKRADTVIRLICGLEQVLKDKGE